MQRVAHAAICMLIARSLLACDCLAAADTLLATEHVQYSLDSCVRSRLLFACSRRAHKLYSIALPLCILELRLLLVVLCGILVPCGAALRPALRRRCGRRLLPPQQPSVSAASRCQRQRPTCFRVFPTPIDLDPKKIHYTQSCNPSPTGLIIVCIQFLSLSCADSCYCFVVLGQTAYDICEFGW